MVLIETSLRLKNRVKTSMRRLSQSKSAMNLNSLFSSQAIDVPPVPILVLPPNLNSSQFQKQITPDDFLDTKSNLPVSLKRSDKRLTKRLVGFRNTSNRQNENIDINVPDNKDELSITKTRRRRSSSESNLIKEENKDTNKLGMKKLSVSPVLIYLPRPGLRPNNHPITPQLINSILSNSQFSNSTPSTSASNSTTDLSLDDEFDDSSVSTIRQPEDTSFSTITPHSLGLIYNPSIPSSS